ncbi:hypothetical protein GCM10018952_63260 [Streptosporangium vulgare]
MEFGNPADAQRAGVAVIYQEPTMFPDLSVAENIFIGRQPRSTLGRIDRGAMRARAAELFAGSASPSTPSSPPARLSIADSSSSRSPRRCRGTRGC